MLGIVYMATTMKGREMMPKNKRNKKKKKSYVQYT